MNTNKNKTTNTHTEKQAAADSGSSLKAKTIKLGIDVHLDRFVVVRIIDGGTPQPVHGDLIRSIGALPVTSRPQPAMAWS